MGGNPFACAGEAQPFLRGGLDIDLFIFHPAGGGQAHPHGFYKRPQLRLLGHHRGIHIGQHLALSPYNRGHLLQQLQAVRILVPVIRVWEQDADIP